MASKALAKMIGFKTIDAHEELLKKAVKCLMSYGLKGIQVYTMKDYPEKIMLSFDIPEATDTAPE